MSVDERQGGAHEKPLDHNHGRSRSAGLWHAVAHWRNWRLGTKLAAATLVPVVFVIALGTVVIAGQVNDANHYEAVNRRVSLATTVRDTIGAAQQERNAAAATGPAGHGARSAAAEQARSGLDKRLGQLRSAVNKSTSLHQLPVARWSETEAQLDKLDTLRGQWESDSKQTVTGYTDMIRSLLGLERALAGGAGTREVTQPAIALYDLDAAAEQVYSEQAVVLAGITHRNLGSVDASSLTAAEALRAGKLAEFRSLAGQEQLRHFDAVMSTPEMKQHAILLRKVTDNASSSASVTSSASTNSSLDLNAPEWNSSSKAVTSRIERAADDLDATVRHNAAALQNRASDGAGIASVVLFCAILVATAVVWMIALQLLRSIRTVQTAAQDVATRRLPDAVTDVQQGREVTQAIEPVGVDTDEEVGRLARAFDAVHREARKLAVEQAGMRASYGNVFVNISRRSQSLVQRQLRLLERLERDEEDAEQLSTLFQLDHLATRMRRNNENLMVLSASEPASKGAPQQPALVGELLRAAVSEIEHYERVAVQLPPSVMVLGYAAGDLVHLVAELLDNATAFSAPDTQVTVGTGHAAGGKLVIDIVDHGIGMNEEDLAEANTRLAAGRDAAEPVARQMGMFVVGKLAERLGITVRLQSGNAVPGVRASIVIPPELVVSSDEPASMTAAPEPSPGAAGRADPLAPPTELPRRAGGARRAEATVPAHEATVPAHDGRNGAVRDVAEPATSGDAAGGAAGALPKRVPDGTQDTARPPAPSSKAGLFTPSVSNGGGPEAPESQSGSQEQTPIFNRMVSAWFDPDAGAASPDTSEAPTRHSSPWSFAADAGMHAAQEVSRHEAESRTSAGLPKRAPRARLVPGRAEPAQHQQPAWPSDPEKVRNRMASFQRGVDHGRAGESAAGDAGDAFTTTEQSNGLPRRDPWPAHNPDTAPQAPDEQRHDEQRHDEQRWHSPADDGFAAAAEVAAAEPAEQTNTGLPRRTPRARLLPGHAEPAQQQEPAWPSDPDKVRDRMASFQRGIHHGRQSNGKPPEDERTQP